MMKKNNRTSLGQSALNTKSAALAAVFALATFVSNQAETWVVDQNEANQSADFVSLQAAVDAAAPEDVIYLMPSDVQNDLATIGKPLTIIGSGFAKDVYFPNVPNVDSLIGPLSITATNVFLSGLVFQGDVEVVAPSKGVTFFRNWMSGSATRDLDFSVALNSETGDVKISDLHIINNWFSLAAGDQDLQLVQAVEGVFTEVEGLVFCNNAVWVDDLNMGNGDAEIYNNYFAVDDFWFSAGSGTTGRCYNNLIHFDSSGQLSSWRGEMFFTHNWHTGATPQIGYWDGSLNPRFTAFSEVIVDSGRFGQQFELVPDSPLAEAGLNGEDIGIFGGVHAYNLSSQPPIPLITRLEAPRVVGSGEGLTFTVEVQANN